MLVWFALGMDRMTGFAGWAGTAVLVVGSWPLAAIDSGFLPIWTDQAFKSWSEATDWLLA